MTELDQLYAHLLGRLYTVEAVLMLLVMESKDPAGFRLLIENLQERSEAISLNQPVSDGERSIVSAARLKSFHAIFPSPEKG